MYANPPGVHFLKALSKFRKREKSLSSHARLRPPNLVPRALKAKEKRPGDEVDDLHKREIRHCYVPKSWSDGKEM